MSELSDEVVARVDEMHRRLDADPDAFDQRGVLADLLEENGARWAHGMRALGRLRRRPVYSVSNLQRQRGESGTWGIHDGNGTLDVPRVGGRPSGSLDHYECERIFGPFDAATLTYGESSLTQKVAVHRWDTVAAPQKYALPADWYVACWGDSSECVLANWVLGTTRRAVEECVCAAFLDLPYGRRHELVAGEKLVRVVECPRCGGTGIDPDRGRWQPYAANECGKCEGEKVVREEVP